MRSHRQFWNLLLLSVGLLVGGCPASQPIAPTKLVIGVVRYDTEISAVEKYAAFKTYLASEMQAFVELEPAFNELSAVSQVQRQAWSIVFAPPGLAAIAIAEQNYTPIFSMQGVQNTRSVLIVREDSSIQKLADLQQKILALGEPGSATGYYLPLYDLYGLTLAEVKFAPTPKTVLEWLANKTIDAGALSEPEFQRYRNEFRTTQFRILHLSRFIPPGLVLLSPKVDRNQQQMIVNAMKAAPPSMIGDAGYIPNVQLPDYQQFIEFVEKVRPLEQKVRQKPAVLVPDTNPTER